jgi:hypothetical protein
MVERRHRADFPLEALAAIRIAGKGQRQHFEGDAAVQPFVLRQ